MKYDHKAIEPKWQEKWEEAGVFHAENGSDKPKYYALIEFPYPSGQGLHVGHPRPYTALDVVARKRRMQGYNVLYPIGWDAFGLPTENYAIKNHVHPAEVTKQNIARFKKQIQSLGISFDWSREISTTDPEYYKWTQWIFLQLFKAGLAYKKEMNVNWCTSCKCVLANEEVVNGVCERCGSEVVHKVKSQWMLKITEYAQRLIDDLDLVDYPERVKTQQKNWIGRSTGAEVDFDTTAGDKLTVYTTRPDTLYGATYMVVSPEHPYLEKWADKLQNLEEIKAYQEQAARKSDFERTEVAKEKTGVKLQGVSAINPLTGREIPIFISDYVLVSYGTGAIMAVPAHDTRDWEFAKKFGLPIIEVVKGGDVEKEAFTDCETGIMVNSGILDGLTVEEAKKRITQYLEEKGIGHAKVNYKLRDWVFSRQRYWGEPIPVVYCEKCGWVPLPESELPLKLPEVKSYEPTDNGESPLAHMTDWVSTTCPHCGGPARRETDTMPQWAGSSWYFLRYMDPHNDKALASQEALRYWGQVDWYNGGMEHTTLHLLYSRFWHKFLYDLGVVPYAEPYHKRTSHGMILGEGGEKMSKSRGNVVNPNDVVAQYGADTMRLAILFIAPPEKDFDWDEDAVAGANRFIKRAWRIVWQLAQAGDASARLTPGSLDAAAKQLYRERHRTLAKCTEDFDRQQFNTAISAIMELVNAASAYLNATEADPAARDAALTWLVATDIVSVLAPICPFWADELWHAALGHTESVYTAPWPEFDLAEAASDTVEIAVQVLGKVRARVEVSTNATQDEMRAVAEEAAAKWIEGKTVVKAICVPGKLVNLVVK